MKAFIYLSVLLITAGSAFGLADYFKEKKKGTFTQLYKEEEEPAAVPVNDRTVPSKQKATTATMINFKPGMAVSNEQGAAKPAPVKKVKKKAPRKPVSLKMFTRGDEVQVREMVAPKIMAAPSIIEKKAPTEAVMEEKPVVKEPLSDAAITATPVAEPVIEKEVKRPSLTKMFSRGRPPKMVKKPVSKLN
jgi:hypothetical protein